MSTVLPDPATPFGERVARRLRDEPIIWLTTIGADGTPQPNPVWFLWDGESFLIYSLNTAKRLNHVQRSAKVSLHFDGDGTGGDIIIFTGTVEVRPEELQADKHGPYVEKYKEFIARSFQTPERFAALYSTPLRIRPTRVRGH
ncbi:MAG TPA: TIGR03667 family PPOX class F420-dependent oxidoreductase [Chloroflexota bacterium]|jgi:PPOX class probable F420-dependent enzyme